MGDFLIVPLPAETAAEVRSTLRAPGYGHPAHAELAGGYGPCRSCLQTFSAGEERRILFTYDPFAGRERFPLPGPVYVHEQECEPYENVHVFPPQLQFLAVTLNAYGGGRVLREQVRIHGVEADAALAELFARPEVDYVHVRNTEAGCFVCHAARAA